MRLAAAAARISRRGRRGAVACDYLRSKANHCLPRATWYAQRVSSDEVRAYAWNWFAMHAGQRLQLVNFWLVAVAFLAAAFVQSQISHLRPIAAGVALIGVVASVAFQRLDVRTRQLSQIAEDALREFDGEWVAQGANELIALVRRAHEVRRNWTDSYRVIIQGLQLSVGLVFLA